MRFALLIDKCNWTADAQRTSIGGMSNQITVGRYTVETRGSVVILRLADKRAVEVRVTLQQLERWIARKMREGMFS